jgi:hypothetical protein
MKKLFLILGILNFVFLLSFKSVSKSGTAKGSLSDLLKSVSANEYYKSDTIKFKQDTIFVYTTKAVKKVQKPDAEKEDITSIEFVGNTEMQKAISDNSGIPANAGLGVRFTKTFNPPTSLAHIEKLELDLSISIASTIDTIMAKTNSSHNILNVNAFGSSILLPLNSGQSVSFSFRAFKNIGSTINWVFGKNWGYEGSFTASNRVWNVADTSQNVSSISGCLGIFSELMSLKDVDNFSISAGIDFSFRSILGNLGHEYASEFRKRIIGTDKTSFFGFEPNITIRLKDIKAIASFPILFLHNDVPGLNRGQFVAMIKFTGGFPLGLTKK